MQRYIGIGMMVLGILIAVLGFPGILPQMGSSGLFLFLGGGLVLGLSFIPKPEPESEAEMSLPSRLLNLFFSPSDVFTNIRSYPTYLGVLLIVAILGGTYTTLFVSRVTPERIARFTTEKLEESGWVPPDQIPQVEKNTLEANSLPTARVGAFISGFAGLIFLCAILGLELFVCALVMGAKINYLQALSVAAFTMFPITLIRAGLSTLILFLKDPADLHPIRDQQSLLPDNLGALVSAGDNPVLFAALSTVGILSIYWIVLTIFGIKHGATKGSTGAGALGAIVVWFLGLGFAVVIASLFGSMLA